MLDYQVVADAVAVLLTSQEETMEPRGAGGGAALRQRARAGAAPAAPRRAAGGGVSTAEIELAVRIRPGAASVVDVAETGAVHVGGESFTYQSSVVRGSDQVVAFDALASRLIRRAQVRALHSHLFHSHSHTTLRSLCGAGGLQLHADGLRPDWLGEDTHYVRSTRLSH